MNIFAIIRLAKQIQTPPDLEDEGKFRAWWQRTATTATRIAEEVDVEAEHSAAIMVKIGSDDELWGKAYQVLLDADRYMAAMDRVLAAGLAHKHNHDKTTADCLGEVMYLIDVLRGTL